MNYKFMICIFILVVTFHPVLLGIVYTGGDPIGTDVIGGIGQLRQIQLQEQMTREESLWNPYIFSGMPIYWRHRDIASRNDQIVGGMVYIVLMGLYCIFIGRIKINRNTFDILLGSGIIMIIIISFVFLFFNMQSLLGKYYSSVEGIVWCEKTIAITISLFYAITGTQYMPLSVCFGYAIANNIIDVIRECCL